MPFLFASFVHCVVMSIFVLCGFSSALASPKIPPASCVNVCSAIVYDLDNDAILFEQNADEQIPPASLTKIMSMFLAMDFIKNGHASVDSKVLISGEAAAVGGSRMGLRHMESVSLGKLLLGMAVSSGNDASHAMAEYVGGSVETFVKMMNVKAGQLGMNNSKFANPHGLPAQGQYSTARDMLALARAYLKAHPGCLALHNTKVLEHGGFKTWNKNPLLGQYEGADGLKTGWIRASGYNLIFTASRNGKRLLAVILGAPDIYTRGTEACRLLDAGFQVCGNSAVSVAAALDSIPFDAKRIDPQKTAREAGLLKKRLYAGNSRLVKVGKYGRKGIRQAALNHKKTGKKARLAQRKTYGSVKSAQKRGKHAESLLSRYSASRG